MSVSQAVVKRPVLWLVVFALISITGVYLLQNVAIDMMPEINLPAVMVYTTYPGANPEIVEKSMTQVLESSLLNTTGLKEIKSISQEHSSIIVLEFDYGVKLDTIMSRVRENLDLARDSLPRDASSPIVAQFDPASEPILRVAVRGEAGISQNELRGLAKSDIQDFIDQIDGVASTTIEGGQEAIVRVELSQNRLEGYGVAISEIAGSLALQNVELGAGRIEDGAVDYSIRTTGEYASVSDIANTVVAQINGADIRLLDIGSVSMGFEDESSTVYVNGEPGVYIGVMKQSGANSVAVADRIYERLERIKSLLPPGINLEVVQDETLQTRTMIQELVNSGIQGIILAMLALLLFLRNINGAIIVGISIPLSILITMLVMNLARITLNIMTLTGLILGLGMVVDSSIVILENIYKFREKGEKPDIAAIVAGDEVVSSIVASTLTTVCVFLPMYLFKNRLEIIGVLLQDLIFTIGISLVASLFVAIFLVPVLASKWLPLRTKTQRPLKNKLLKGLEAGVGGTIDAVERGYKGLLTAALSHRLVVFVLVVAAFGGSVLAILKLPITFMPEMDEDTINMNVELPLGTKYEDTRAVMFQLQEIAMTEIKGAESVIINAGSSGGISYAAEGNHTGGMNIKLDLANPAADLAGQAIQKLRSHFGDFPDAVFSFSSDMDIFTGGSDIDMVFRIEDIRQGLADAQEIASILGAELPELIELQIETNAGLPQVEVAIDRGRAYNMGLTVASIAGEIAASMNGISATMFRYEGEEYDVILMLQKEDRYELPDLGRIFVRSSNGFLYPVSNFASFAKTLGPVTINRENQSRVIHITGNLREGYEASDTETKIRSLLADRGFAISFDGEWSNTQSMLDSFLLIITLALLLVFGVMAAQYESFRDPVINFCAIPLMLIGVVLIHILTGKPLSAFTMIGLVMLAGIVVNNGIILVDYTNLLVRRGTPIREACVAAAVARFRPVLMTTLTTILGMVPMAFFPGASSSMTQPIGLVVIGGLSSSTVITLFFIPVMYSLVNRQGKRTIINTTG
jgi:HAE1 family hydrophobic/amphiphilic exporter-1